MWRDNRSEGDVDGRWPERWPEMVPGCQGLTQNAGVRDCTTKQRNTHKIDIREIRYRFHPWYGRRVLVETVRVRNGPVVFRCRIDDDRGFPILDSAVEVRPTRSSCGTHPSVRGQLVHIGMKTSKPILAVRLRYERTNPRRDSV